MPSTTLRRLQPQFRDRITEGFLNGIDSISVGRFVQDADPASYDIAPLANVVDHAVAEWQSARRAESDKWLAPRVHAALRLTRRQASDRGIWDWLATGPLESYVRWRWESDGKVVAARFSSPDFNRQAVSRLWWGAELTRNGSDYTATDVLFHTQDIQNVWSVARFFRNRPVAIAALRFLQSFNDGKVASGDQIKALGKAFNAILTTTVLDSVSVDRGVDATAVREWCDEEPSPDETKWHNELPEGPHEEQLDEEAIERVHELLKHVVSVSRIETPSTCERSG